MMTEEDIYGWEEVNFANAYKNWIERQMHAKDYRILFDCLYDVEFVWDYRIPMDENRAKDGMFLREEFASESGMDEPLSVKYWPCSFLEFLVAVCRRIENQVMYDPDSDTDASTWFWELMGNAGLDICTDTWMLQQHNLASALVYERVNTIMHRTYAPDGTGGLFPMEESDIDQRSVEIWYQINDYFWEKYVKNWDEN